MVLFKIFDVDTVCYDNPLLTLNIGKHTIGRGSFASCNDKRISRNHVEINIELDNVSFTPIHVNPCFYISTNSEQVQVLNKGTTVKLEDGDKIGFLSDNWYKIKIENDDSVDSNVTVDKVEDLDDTVHSSAIQNLPDTSNLKRELTDSDDTPEDNKRFKIDIDDNEQSVSSVKNEDIFESPTLRVEDIKEETVPETSTEVKIEILDSDDEDTKDVKDEGPSTSTNDTLNFRREQCWYAEQCYRKNPTHRSEYSHPGDADYGPDPNDTRPDCQYGASCYRKNTQHRRQFKHPNSRPSPTPSTRGRPLNYFPNDDSFDSDEENFEEHYQSDDSLILNDEELSSSEEGISENSEEFL